MADLPHRRPPATLARRPGGPTSMIGHDRSKMMAIFQGRAKTVIAIRDGSLRCTFVIRFFCISVS
jgi:hypothetical protein